MFRCFFRVCYKFVYRFLALFWVQQPPGGIQDPFYTHFWLLCKGKLPLRGAPGRSQACGPFFYNLLCFRHVFYSFLIVFWSFCYRFASPCFLCFFAEDLNNIIKNSWSVFFATKMKPNQLISGLEVCYERESTLTWLTLMWLLLQATSAKNWYFQTPDSGNLKFPNL